MRRFTVAIDGPAAAGKGTIGRALAARFGFAHLDTGLLYRAVALKMLEAGGPLDAGHAARIARDLVPADIEALGLRRSEVTRESSRIAAIPKVRSALLDFQRSFSRRDGGAVLDGRDIATVIAPDAELKLYVTAEDDVRARRRLKELSNSGIHTTFGKVLADLRERDRRDQNRGLAALRRTDDAILLDTTELSIAQAVEEAAAAVNERFDAVR
ncbi:MAG: (d)CMP kinase [Rhodobacteraceae bacterium]|nr:(d)CMP kinase [Paracoccaceae bacterium]